MKCDLHTHSTFSDGTRTPAAIVDECVKIGLSAIALTDHNTVKGLYEFKNGAEGKNIECVSGVEISTDYKDKDVHIVGLFLNEERYHDVEVFFGKSQRAEAGKHEKAD